MNFFYFYEQLGTCIINIIMVLLDIMEKMIEFTQKPWSKVLIYTLCPIIIGVISNVYVMDISSNEGMKFTNSFNKISFYLLLLFILIIGIYNFIVFRHEKDLLKFKNRDYCIIYMRSQLLPELAESYKKRIKEGQIDDMEKTMEDFKRMLEI